MMVMYSKVWIEIGWIGVYTEKKIDEYVFRYVFDATVGSVEARSVRIYPYTPIPNPITCSFQ